MAEERAIEVHQTVHGYRDGHELVASSLTLTGATRRAMLALSDLSGDGNPRGFDEYITGYPLEDVELYAFARTWYAPEMKRPGCVWTHTLLVNMKDLGSIPEPGTLRALFQRPEAGRIPATLASIRYECRDAVSQPVAVDGPSYEIVTRLYGQERPVLIFGDSAAQYEDTLIRIWTQQPSRWRCTFAFCSGSLEPRLIEKRPFDLQVVPQQRQRKTLRSSDNFSVVSSDDLARSNELAARVREALARLTPLEERVIRMRFGIGETGGHLLSENEEPQHWHDVLVQDFSHPLPALRKFVEQYGIDVPPHRRCYRDLVNCWAMLETLHPIVTSLQELTRTLARAFPRRRDASALKRAVLGANSIVPGARESDLVHELLTVPSVSAFDATDLDISSRAGRLFREGTRWRAHAVTWLLTCDQLNEVGREWADSVLAHLSVDDLSGLFSEDRDLFAKLLKDRPALAKQEHLWRQPRELVRAAVHILPTIEDQEHLGDIITSIVAANATNAVPSLLQSFGTSVVGKLLTGLDRNRCALRDLDEWQWSSQLRGYDVQLVEWLKAVDRADAWTLTFIATLLGLHSSALAGTPNATFLRHLNAPSVIPTADATTDFSSYCFALGLRNYNGHAAPMAVAAFDAVHEAALRSKLTRRSLQWLGPYLPRRGWFSGDSWDDGEKVRRALVDAFLLYRWSPSLLRDAIPNEQTKVWITGYCDSFSSGRDLLRRAGLTQP